MTLRRVPITGWSKCVHEAPSFESKGEYSVAAILDSAQVVEWWLRNDPHQVAIPTPAGDLRPDFVYKARRSGRVCMGLIEVKGEIFWDGEGSAARIKAKAAREWAKAVSAAGASPQWEFAAVLEEDTQRAKSLEELLASGVELFPERRTSPP